ncbi:MAG: DNA/RNA nuclease SfsA [Massiliimalia sp.]|jgi:sugar fermentation stimulation protein A
MEYQHIRQAVFLRRPNRFIAHILIDGKEQLCHVKNTGRCAELLIPNRTIYVQQHNDSARKTQFSLIAVQKGERLINMDSQIPNRVVEEWLRKGGLGKELTLLRPETKWGNSRFDFYGETETSRFFMEVKGVTLEEDGIVRFPDAPTQRGIKHLEELCLCVKEGYEAYALFLIQMKGVRWFEPNWKTHADFGTAMEKAKKAGVHLLAMDCNVTPEHISAGDFVEIRL